MAWDYGGSLGTHRVGRWVGYGAAVDVLEMCWVLDHVSQVLIYDTLNSFFFYGPGSLVGIPTDYGLDGPGLNPGGDKIFRPSRPALGPAQPPVKWVLGLSRGVKCGRGVPLTANTLLVPQS